MSWQTLDEALVTHRASVASEDTSSIANPHVCARCNLSHVNPHMRKNPDTRLSPAERTAKLLAFKPLSNFNSPIRASVLLGTSAQCKAKAAI